VATTSPLTAAELPAATAVAAATGTAAAPAAWARALASGHDHLLARHDRGALVAVAWLRRAADEAEVLDLAVDPAQRRRGHGHALLLDAAAQVHAAGARRLLLEVRADNAAARALYAGAGLVQVGTRPGYHRDGADALLLAADLPLPRPLPRPPPAPPASP